MIYIVSDNDFFYQNLSEYITDKFEVINNISTRNIHSDDIVILTSFNKGESGDICSGMIYRNKSLPCGDSRTILITGSVDDSDLKLLKARIKVFSKLTPFWSDVVKYIEELKGK